MLKCIDFLDTAVSFLVSCLLSVIHGSARPEGLLIDLIDEFKYTCSSFNLSPC